MGFSPPPPPPVPLPIVVVVDGGTLTVLLELIEPLGLPKGLLELCTTPSSFVELGESTLVEYPGLFREMGRFTLDTVVVVVGGGGKVGVGFLKGRMGDGRV